MSATPICKTMCGTCPFREGSPYAYLQSYLTENALTQSSRLCHSTGTNAINGRTGKPELICRGTRDIQLRMMHAMGVIAAPTDAAWDAMCRKLGLPTPPQL